MLKRILTALVALPILVWAVFCDWPWLFLALILAAALIGVQEFYHLVQGCNLYPHTKFGMLFTVLLVFFSATRDQLPFGQNWDWILVLGVFSFFLISLLREKDFSRVPGAVATTLLGAFYVGGLLAYLPRLKFGPTEFHRDVLLLVFVLVFACDTGAMFTGKLIGKHKMAPKVSPKKTWQGFIGGILGSALGLLAAQATFFQALTWIDIVLLAPAITVIGQLGDLFVSQMKRGAKAKDSGSLLPGHGGLMDRLDSLLFGGPMLYYYFRLAWPLWGEGGGL